MLSNPETSEQIYIYRGNSWLIVDVLQDTLSSFSSSMEPGDTRYPGIVVGDLRGAGEKYPQVIK